MLQEKIEKDYIEAMKARDSLRSSTLSFLKSQVKNVIIGRKIKALEDPDVITVIKKQIKQRQESIEQYTAGKRLDLAEKETAELNILKSYLPQEMSDQEIQTIVSQTIQEVAATSAKDMGKVMKAIGPKVAGKADNKRVSEIVKSSLEKL